MIVNLTGQYVVLDDGWTCPITNMIDEYGEETTEPQECCMIVAGPMQDGQWAVIRVISDKVTIN